MYDMRLKKISNPKTRTWIMYVWYEIQTNIKSQGMLNEY